MMLRGISPRSREHGLLPWPEQIKKAVGDLILASAARVGRELNFIGPGAIGLIYKELDAMTEVEELEKTWINNQFLFSVKDKS